MHDLPQEAKEDSNAFIKTVLQQAANHLKFHNDLTNLESHLVKLFDASHKKNPAISDPLPAFLTHLKDYPDERELVQSVAASMSHDHPDFASALEDALEELEVAERTTTGPSEEKEIYSFHGNHLSIAFKKATDNIQSDSHSLLGSNLDELFFATGIIKGVVCDSTVVKKERGTLIFLLRKHPNLIGVVETIIDDAKNNYEPNPTFVDSLTQAVQIAKEQPAAQEQKKPSQELPSDALLTADKIALLVKKQLNRLVRDNTLNNHLHALFLTTRRISHLQRESQGKENILAEMSRSDEEVATLTQYLLKNPQLVRIVESVKQAMPKEEEFSFVIFLNTAISEYHTQRTEVTKMVAQVTIDLSLADFEKIERVLDKKAFIDAKKTMKSRLVPIIKSMLEGDDLDITAKLALIEKALAQPIRAILDQQMGMLFSSWDSTSTSTIRYLKDMQAKLQAEQCIAQQPSEHSSSGAIDPDENPLDNQDHDATSPKPG